ncbi:DUF4440 domain-containing protein [Algoriphagus vanfongensis]|uniref:DUF4440 domain-containing protein n=1 Tax=Algoriphagus vanfongensis TaxID=426371 RepID=UPI0004007FE7|nr:DUF4440 domain-containing protein [Algoriphagus vanfongensis]
MKSLLLSFLLLVSFSGFAQEKSDEKAVQDLIQGSFDHLFSEFDSDRIFDFYTEDFLLLEQGEVWDMKIIQDYFAKAKQNENRPTRTNRFEFISTKIDGNRAWVAYHNYATITRDGQVIREIEWLESATAIKTSKGWRLDMLHSTRIEKE